MVDSSVMLDVLTDDVMWGEWSRQALARASDEGRLAISPIVYVEISIGFGQIEDLDNAVSVSEFERESRPYEAGFLASREFVDYRRCQTSASVLRHRTRIPTAHPRCQLIPHVVSVAGDTCSLTPRRTLVVNLAGQVHGRSKFDQTQPVGATNESGLNEWRCWDSHISGELPVSLDFDARPLSSTPTFYAYSPGGGDSPTSSSPSQTSNVILVFAQRASNPVRTCWAFWNH